MNDADPPPQQPYAAPAAAPAGANQGSTRWALGLSIAAITVALLALLVVLVVTFSSFFTYGAFEDYGDGEEYLPPPTNGTAADLDPLGEGDCFVTVINKPKSTEQVECTDRHDGQIYLMEDVDGSQETDYPGDEDIYYRVDERCYTQWEAAFGEGYEYEYEEPSIYYAMFAPTEKTWEEGDRTVACAYYPEGLGSLEGIVGENSQE